MGVKMCAYCGTRPAAAKGFCKTCYQRYRRNGYVEKLGGSGRHGPGDTALGILALYADTGDAKKTAEAFGVTRAYVYQVAKRHGKKKNIDTIKSMNIDSLARVFTMIEKYALVNGPKGTKKWRAWLSEDANDE